MKNIILSFILSLLAFESYSQSQDTFKCYNANELRKIATRLIEKKQCDSILSIANEEIANLYDVIYVKDVIIYNTDSITKLQHSQIQQLQKSYSTLQSKNDRLNKNQRWLFSGLLVSILANIVLIATK